MKVVARIRRQLGTLWLNRPLTMFVSMGVVLALVAGIIALTHISPHVLKTSLLGNNVPNSPSKKMPGDEDPTELPTPSTPPVNVIDQENRQQGTSDWQIPYDRGATTQIQAYTSAMSANPGDRITVYVSTQNAGDHYGVDVYRLGWYGGKGGRLIDSFDKTGQAQGVYDAATKQLLNCLSCTIDSATKMVEANWQPSFVYTVPTNAITGLYVMKLTTGANWQTYVWFTVRSSQKSTYLVAFPDNTTVAYNDWGGYSLYHGPDQNLATRAYEVSMERPAPGWRYSYGQGLPYIISAIRWFEANNYDVAYVSNLDMHESPGIFDGIKAYISLGHDEYWSHEMRDVVENARNHGVGLAFLGANAAYWQIRYAPNRYGAPDRRIICYKDAKKDPLVNVDNAHATVQFRQAPVNRPENALIGIMYSNWITPPKSYQWRIAPQAGNLPLLADTNLQPNQEYGCGLVGYEWDHTFNNGQTPATLKVLASTVTIGADGKADVSQTTYYTAPSGAFVFASGSIYFAHGLDDLFLYDVPVIPPAPSCGNPDALKAVPGIQMLMKHVMAELVVSHA